MKKLNTYINEALIKKDTKIKNYETYDNYIVIPYHQEVYSLLREINSDSFYSNTTEWWIVKKDELIPIINDLLTIQKNEEGIIYLIYGIKENITHNVIKTIKDYLHNFKFWPERENFFIKLFPKIEDISRIE